MESSTIKQAHHLSLSPGRLCQKLFLMHHPKWTGSEADKARPSFSLWGSKERKSNEASEVKMHSTSFVHFCQWWRCLQRRWQCEVSNFGENCKCTIKGKIAFPNFAGVASAAHANARDSAQSIIQQSPADCGSYQPVLRLSTQTVTRLSSEVFLTLTAFQVQTDTHPVSWPHLPLGTSTPGCVMHTAANSHRVLLAHLRKDEPFPSLCTNQLDSFSF